MRGRNFSGGDYPNQNPGGMVAEVDAGEPGVGEYERGVVDVFGITMFADEDWPVMPAHFFTNPDVFTLPGFNVKPIYDTGITGQSSIRGHGYAQTHTTTPRSYSPTPGSPASTSQPIPTRILISDNPRRKVLPRIVPRHHKFFVKIPPASTTPPPHPQTGGQFSPGNNR